MRGISSAVLSLAAMALSSMTTYLTFFDARYTLTQAVANVELQMQSGGGYSDGESSAFYRFYPYPEIILSNRGTRPLVLSNVELVRSEDLDRCDPEGETPPMNRIDAVIIEPGTVQQLDLQMELPSISGEAGEDPGGDPAAFGLSEEIASLWCLRWTVFDPNGQRREPLTPAFTTVISFEDPEDEDDRYPDPKVDLDFPKGPSKLIARGLF